MFVFKKKCCLVHTSKSSAIFSTTFFLYLQKKLILTNHLDTFTFAEKLKFIYLTIYIYIALTIYYAYVINDQQRTSQERLLIVKNCGSG